MVQVVGIPNYMNMNVHVEKEQFVKNMTIYPDLENIMFLYVVMNAKRNIK